MQGNLVMARAIVINQGQQRDFEAILDLELESLQKIVNRLRQLPVAPIRPEPLLDIVAGVLQSQKAIAGSIITQAMALQVWTNDLQEPEILAGIRDALRVDFGWSEQQLEKWRHIESAVKDLLMLPVIRLAAAVMDLSNEYLNQWRGARILTDIRPIFTNDATGMDGAIVSHTFRLYFDGISGRNELQVVLDEGDIRLLAEQCDRAICKAKTARDIMAGDAKVPTLISGETEDV